MAPKSSTRTRSQIDAILKAPAADPRLALIQDLIDKGHNPWSAIQDGSFESKVVILPRPDPPNVQLDVWNSSDEEIEAARAQAREFHAAKALYEDSVERSHEDKALQERRFRLSLEHHFGVIDNPKAVILYQLAWEHGHSAGFSEILSCYSDFVVLVQ